MIYENKYTTIEYKTHRDLNEKLMEYNSDGWEVVSISKDDKKKSAEILLKRIKESTDKKQILNG